MWDPSRPTRLTIPSGYSKAEFWGYGKFPSGDWILSIVEHDASTDASTDVATNSTGDGANANHTAVMVKSPLIDVTAGTSYSLNLFVSGSGDIAFDGLSTEIFGYFGVFFPDFPVTTSGNLFTLKARLYP
jgi:hypothetical protein